jgi:hypothetical protein
LTIKKCDPIDEDSACSFGEEAALWHKFVLLISISALAAGLEVIAVGLVVLNPVAAALVSLEADGLVYQATTGWKEFADAHLTYLVPMGNC